MTKCSFCGVEGHKINACRDPRIATVMRSIESAGCRGIVDLDRALRELTTSELSIAMVQYGITGLSVSKERKIELLLNRCVRRPATRVQEPRVQEPTANRRIIPARLSYEARREIASKLANDVCKSTYVQADVLFERVRNGSMTLPECVEKYNEYRKMIVRSALSEINSGPDNRITMNDFSTMFYEEMNCINRLRSCRIAQTVYEGLRDYGGFLRRSMETSMGVRSALFRNRHFLLTRDALHHNLLSPREMDDMTEELMRLIQAAPIDISPLPRVAPACDRSHIKPLCIEVTRSSSKIDDVRGRDSVDECMICMTAFDSKEAPEVPLLLGCEHICCTSCFITIAKNRKKSFITCPFCREEVAQCVTPNKESMDLVALNIKNA